MRQLFKIIPLLFTFTAFGQKKPLPPKPPQREKTTEQAPTQKPPGVHGEQQKTILPKFDIPISASTDMSSAYYFKTVEDKLVKLDTTITPEQIISLTKFNIYRNQTAPSLLDSLANQTYKLNENGKYDEAIKTATIILAQSPNNITGHKEISLAYKKIGKDNLHDLHFAMLSKIIKSVFKYGDGAYEYPFLINNFFEGLSIYEALFRCTPNKVSVMLDKRNRLLGAYNGYSSAMDEVLIRYAELTHWKSQLKEGKYRREGH